jgi:hypothetical protein
MCLCFGLGDVEIAGYTDANFAGNVNDRKSSNGYVFLFGGTTIFWLSKKQNYIAKSTVEVEYILYNPMVNNAI